jgi:hypothetical protein
MHWDGKSSAAVKEDPARGVFFHCGDNNSWLTPTL